MVTQLVSGGGPSTAPGHVAVLTAICTLGCCSLDYFYFISLRNTARQLSFSWELPGSWSVPPLPTPGNRAEEMFPEGLDGDRWMHRPVHLRDHPASVPFVPIQTPNKALLGGLRDSGQE